jgi:hypothetical protein
MASYLRSKVRTDKKDRRAVVRNAETELQAAQAGCVGKRKFDSYSEARRNLPRSTSDGKGVGGRMNSYKCRICHGYHNGHSNIVNKRPVLEMEEV